MSAWRFMGEQEDPELANLLGRGDMHVYGVNRTSTQQDWQRAPARPNPDAGFYVQQRDGRSVRCGCGRCFTGPCLSPKEDVS